MRFKRFLVHFTRNNSLHSLRPSSMIRLTLLVEPASAYGRHKATLLPSDSTGFSSVSQETLCIIQYKTNDDKFFVYVKNFRDFKRFVVQ